VLPVETEPEPPEPEGVPRPALPVLVPVPVLVLALPPRPAPLLVPVEPAVDEVPVAGCVSVPVSPSETSGLLSLLQAAVASSAVVANTHTLFVIIAQLHVGSEPIIRGLSFTRVTENKKSPTPKTKCFAPGS
jgi:hypothetical protein